MLLAVTVLKAPRQPCQKVLAIKCNTLFYEKSLSKLNKTALENIFKIYV